VKVTAIIIMAATVLATCPRVCAQEMRTDEASRPSQTDPLGFGGLSKNRPKGSVTEITAQKDAVFNEKENKAIFTGDVRVKDPAFLLNCDNLTVFLFKDRSGIDHAEARGNVVIVQQPENPSEKGAVGRAREAVYVPGKGEVTLIGWPEVQQGINRHVSTEQGTRMTLNRGGRATTDGPSKTVITDTTEAGKLP
jgi:lipopolysaccharide transport protein LptA